LTLPHVICQYCSHLADGAKAVCEHCGAPLPGPGAGPERERVLAEIEKVAEGSLQHAGRALASAAGPAVVTQVRMWLLQWRVVAAVVCVLIALVGALVRSCSGMPSAGRLTPVQALPPELRAASSCTRFNADGVDECVVAPGSSILLGGITGGRELTFYLQVDPPDRLAATIGRWRDAGGSVLSDASVFLEIGPSETVWYANTRTGFHLETGTFVSRSGAQTFLVRSGLAN
jgi:hypothetical protein